MYPEKCIKFNQCFWAMGRDRGCKYIFVKTMVNRLEYQKSGNLKFCTPLKINITKRERLTNFESRFLIFCTISKKDWIKQEVSKLDIRIKQSLLKVSNSKVPSSVYTEKIWIPWFISKVHKVVFLLQSFMLLTVSFYKKQFSLWGHFTSHPHYSCPGPPQAMIHIQFLK